CQQYNDLRLTF
nr:immunoglobulin light chain junction region [Macaca mulatta]MOY10875.1 immunoglobulin light chain junction region [Macaca mulatta]MOY11584.1 immunoglobulin light chain junction region [Macaca mulatta]MOY11890.1 immunoglobulin light chain junction region [Macaca mulatta]MOY12181.1 immunoglobulin light chain junction region [Macaca mulatta]